MRDYAGLLHAKRDGCALAEADVRTLVSGVTDGSLSDARLGAFAMAVCHRGMTMEEQVTLTLAMRDSGTVLDWRELDGPAVDKHSTGGVGDVVSLLLGPMLAACGAYVPMISGRGLGHTGGTLDKLESIPGFEAFPDLDRFRGWVRQAGVAIVGQTGELAPADRRLYAVRDETSTVPSVPLIVSSILSKKLAEGLNCLVLDVKAGNGAFMQSVDGALDLARQLVEVSERAGLPCSALVTDMNQPLAWSAGNALEVREVIDFFHGRRRTRLAEVTLALGALALHKAGLAAGVEQARERCRQALESGAAAESFARMIATQGGPSDLLQAPDRYFPPAPFVAPVPAPADGWVGACDTTAVGMAVVHLGGGRQQLTDKIDHRVGLSGLAGLGDRIERGAPLATVHAVDEASWSRAARALSAAFEVRDTEPQVTACIHDHCNGMTP